MPEVASSRPGAGGVEGTRLRAETANVTDVDRSVAVGDDATAAEEAEGVVGECSVSWVEVSTRQKAAGSGEGPSGRSRADGKGFNCAAGARALGDAG